MWHQFELPDLALELSAMKCPVALMWGSRSKLMSGKLLDYAMKLAPKGTPKIEIPDAEHHVIMEDLEMVQAADKAGPLTIISSMI